MSNVNSFYIVDGCRWSIKYEDGSVLDMEEAPIKYEYIGESKSLEPLDVVDGYCFEAYWNFENGLCPIRINGKWGFINSELVIVIQPVFDFVGEVHSQKLSCWRPEEFIHRVLWEGGVCKAHINDKDVNINERGEILYNYETDIQQNDIRTIYDIIDWCHGSLPQYYQKFPWKHPELNHGIDLLASDEALNCYMSAYGDMHTGKCRAAMMNFPYEDLNGTIEIVDWGCGQGIASGVVIDLLDQHNLLPWLKRVTLIEPSQTALQRAVSNVSKITHNNIQIVPINKFMPAKGVPSDDNLQSVGYAYTNVIHLFSNVLDIKSIDLAQVARFVASSHGKHFVLCIGPKNGAAYRIEQFCAAFGEQQYFSKIDNVNFGRTKRTGHPYTCLTRCFSYDGSPLDLSRMSQFQDSGQEVFDEYDLRLQIQNKVLTTPKARVAFRLQEIMSLDDIIYINPVVNEVSVDFIIVRPNKGILLVNVFESDLNKCSLSEDKSEIIVDNKRTYQSPLELVTLCQTSIKDGIEELLISTIENSRNFSLIKKAVIFTENDINSVKSFFNTKQNHVNFTYLFGKEFIKDKSVSHNLYQTINFLYNSADFDNVVIRKLASIISPSWHSYQEGRIGVEPKGAQRGLVISRGNTQQKISGVAGSGKTHVLAARAINAIKRTGGNVLILTYNITLVNYLKYRLSEIREDFSWDKIDIYHYHQFFRIRASECHLHVGFSSYDNVNFFSNSDFHKRYSAVFVDEVQDYTTEWLRIVMNYFLEAGGEFVVFGDPKQNVYHRPLDANKDIRLGVIGGVWNRELNKGRRFSNPRLASLATSFQSTFLSNLPTDSINTDSPIESTFNFQIVTYYDMRNNYSMENLVTKLIEIIKNDTNEAQDFVILGSSTKFLRLIDSSYRAQTGKDTEITFVSTEQFEKLKRIHRVTDEQNANWKFKRDFESIERVRKQLFTTDKRCLKISTIQSFKGWESPSVIVILEEDDYAINAFYRPMAPESIYTAITRARENLYIINIGNYTYHNFFKTQSI